MQDHQPPLPAGSPTGEQLAAILRYTRRPFAPEELYVFPAVLCDNQIDRDGERFSTACLHQLAELFAGVTGVFDHRATASGQHARIFSCRVEEDPSRESNCPEPYAALRAEIYMPRTESTAALIAEIDAGIKKEVSVSCAVSGSVCSVCGQPAGSCAHQKGRLYDGPCPCHTVHTGAADAYEWSFVAVPAQRGAGVTKRLKRTAEVPPPPDGQLAALGREYLDRLRREYVRLSLLAVPDLTESPVKKQAALLGPEELREALPALEKAAARRLPLPRQLPWQDPPDAPDRDPAENPYRLRRSPAQPR